jgi:hypothetical protein
MQLSVSLSLPNNLHPHPPTLNLLTSYIHRHTYIFSNTLSPQFCALVSLIKSSFSAVSELKVNPVEHLLKWSEM